jgi:hypothetical protein
MLRPDLFTAAVLFFTPYRPNVDLFASPQNNLLPNFCSHSNSAFSYHWGSLGTVWANPPFHLLNAVWHKAQHDHAVILLLAPLWNSPLLRSFFAHARKIFPLPDEPLFCRSHSSTPLPTPPWRAAVFLLDFSTRSTRWIHDPTKDGDVEPNPGPPLVPLATFYSTFYRTFADTADKTALARQAIQIRIRTQDWPETWVATVTSGCNGIPSMEEAYSLLAAYEIFSETQLTMDGQGFSWVTTQSDEVATLRERIRLLELTRIPPSKTDLLSGPTPDNFTRFRLLPGLPTWLSTALDLFEKHHSPPLPSPSPLLEGLWHCLVDAYFDGSGTPKPPAGRPHPNTIRRPAELSLSSLKEQGGRVETEVTDHGTVTWAFLREKRYFLSKKGALWDTSIPPPAPCFSCGTNHWFWECPHNSSSSPPK